MVYIWVFVFLLHDQPVSYLAGHSAANGHPTSLDPRATLRYAAPPPPPTPFNRPFSFSCFVK